MLSEIFNLIFGLSAFFLSFRYELGILNYAVGLNYIGLGLFGIEIVRVAICGSSVDYRTSIALALILLTAYNNAVLLMFDKIVLVFVLRFLVIGIVITSIALVDLGFITEILLALCMVNAIVIICIRMMHRDKFRYGTIHQRYAYAAMVMYLLICAELICELFVKKEIHIYFLLLPLAFNYDFQLNLYYKTNHWEYSTFVRSGLFSRLLFIVDYYERTVTEPTIFSLTVK